MTTPVCKRHPDVEMVVVEEGTLNGVAVRYYGCPATAIYQRDCRLHSSYGTGRWSSRWFDDPQTTGRVCGCVTRHCNTVERVDEPIGVQADLFGGDT